MKNVAEALANLDQAAGANFWHISKGKCRPHEPLYAAAIYPGRVTHEEDQPLAIAEGDDLATVINDCVRDLARPKP
jgi:hypothetical protein